MFEPLESRQLLSANEAPVNLFVAQSQVSSEVSSALVSLSISDVDAGSAAIRVTLSVNHGTLSVPTNISAGVTSGELAGNGTPTLTLNAPLSAINATFADLVGLRYLSDADHLGSDALSIYTEDLGNSGTGLPQSDYDVIDFEVGVHAEVTAPGQVSILGTSADDEIDFVRTVSGVDVTVRGVTSTFDAITSFSFNGLGGRDSIRVFDGLAQNADQYVLKLGQLTISGPGMNASLIGEDLFVYGGTGDVVQIIGNAAPTTLSQSLLLSGSGLTSWAANFSRTYVFGNSSDDRAYLVDSPGTDVVYMLNGQTTHVRADGSQVTLVGFEQVVVQSVDTGVDKVLLYDTPGNDYFNFTPAVAQMVGPGMNNIAYGFEFVYAFAGAGRDLATMVDSAGSDTFYGYPAYSILSGANFFAQATGFDAAVSRSVGGQDTAWLYDSPGNDYFYGSVTNCVMSSPLYYNQVFGFENVRVIANRGGRDFAYITGSLTTNDLSGSGSRFQIIMPNLNIQLTGFDEVNITAPAGSASRRQVRAVDYVLRTIGVFR